MEADMRADRFDALLNQRVLPSAGDEVFIPLLDTAASLQSIAHAQASPSFARALEEKLMRETDALAERKEPMLALAGASSREATSPRIMRRQPRWSVSRRRLFWQLAVAALLLICIAVPLSLAAYATPDSPLFGLRRLEQGVQVGLTADPASRAKLQLDFTRDSLTALENAISKGDHLVYRTTLPSFQSAYNEAKRAVAAAQASDQRSSLNATLELLRTRATSDLYHALSGMEWSDRLTTTAALGTLGNVVPVITQVTYARGSGATSNADGMAITIHGSGFAPGANVFINGQSGGEVRRMTANDILAILQISGALNAGTVVGVENPDGTAAQMAIQVRGNPPEIPPTKTPGDHHGHG